MTLMIGIVLILMTLLAAAVASVKVPHTRLSKYELKRLVGRGDERAITEHYIETYRSELYSLLRLTTLLLLFVTLIIALTGLGIAIGTIVAIVIIVIYAPLARLPIISRLLQPFFDSHIDSLIAVIARFSLLRTLLNAPQLSLPLEPKVHSREELAHTIEHSGAMLVPHERDLLLHALRFDSRTVEELMVPAQQVVSVNKKELLGPLVLDDLHKTGHDMFPVINKDLESAIGVLYLGDLLTVDAGRHSSTAEKAMTPGIERIKITASLRQALLTMMNRHHSLLIVVDSNDQSLGIITMTDLIEALFGRRIDEDSTPDSA
jgi:CBS domain containing-hemolysin-like protein